MISVCILTYRPGGIDIIANSFVQSQGADYELILVDDWPGRVERGKVPKYLEERGVKLGWYGKSKPKLYPETRGGFCCAMNTAVSHARGEYTLWVSDYSYMDYNWYHHWSKLIRETETVTKSFMISGSAIVFSAPKPNPTDVATWDGEVDLNIKWPWVPWEWETFYCAIPIRFFESNNGVDERADHNHGWPVSSKLKQGRMLGYSIGTKPELWLTMIDHREWDVEDKENHDRLWKIDGAWSSMEKEPEWEVPSPNSFDLRAMRKENGIE